MFARYEEAEVLYLVNPGDYSICREISRIGAKHKIKIITNDLVTKDQQEMVKNGEIAVTICRNRKNRVPSRWRSSSGIWHWAKCRTPPGTRLN